MLCKCCCCEAPEKDFQFSKGEYEGFCYKCTFKKKGGQPLESFLRIIDDRSKCKTCGSKFEAICSNRGYHTNARYCSDVCRKRAADLSNQNQERKRIKSSWSFSWKKQIFEFKKEQDRCYA